MAGRGKADLGEAWQARRGTAGPGKVRLGRARQARHGAARRLSKGHHQDSLEDAAAYIALAEMLKDTELEETGEQL